MLEPQVYQPQRAPQSLQSAFLVVSPTDVTSLIHSLYPSKRPGSVYSDTEMSRSGIQSSASSVSGFSLFPTISNTELGGAFWSPPRSDNVLAPSVENNVLPVAETPENWQCGSSVIEKSSMADTLRDVCSYIEEISTTESSGEHGNWSVLLESTTDGQLTTVFQRLHALRKATSSRTRVRVPETVHFHGIDRSCLYKDVKIGLKEILGSDDFFHEREYEHKHLDKNIILQDAYHRLSDHATNRITEYQINDDYCAAHDWFQKLHNLERLTRNGNDFCQFSNVLQEIADETQLSLQSSEAAASMCEMLIQST